jgi:hypothetical protein
LEAYASAVLLLNKQIKNKLKQGLGYGRICVTKTLSVFVLLEEGWNGERTFCQTIAVYLGCPQ